MLRAGKYVNLQGAVSISDGLTNVAGRRIILPSTYPGSPRFMTEIYHDAMGICKTFRFPDVFITFTCNSQWPKIPVLFSQEVSGQKIDQIYYRECLK